MMHDRRGAVAALALAAVLAGCRTAPAPPPSAPILLGECFPGEPAEFPATWETDGGGRVVGRVVAAEDGDPLPAAEVRLGRFDGSAFGEPTLTDADGVFVLKDVAAGLRHILVLHIDRRYALGEVRFVAVESPERVEVVLHPQPVCLDGAN